MSTEPMHAAFFKWRKSNNPKANVLDGSISTRREFVVFQAATLAERERAAKVCAAEAAIAVESALFCKVTNVDLRPYAICEAAIRKGESP